MPLYPIISHFIPLYAIISYFMPLYPIISHYIPFYPILSPAEFGHGTDPIWLPAGSALKVSDPPSHKALLGSTTSLPCTFSLGKSPIDHSVLSIIWTFRDKEILSTTQFALPVPIMMSSTMGLIGAILCRSFFSLYQSLFLLFYNFTAVPVVTISRSRANLRCSVSGFYPMDIGVTWLRDGEPIPHSSNIDIRTWSNADGTYTLSNSLSVAPGGGQREGTYSCQVEHKSLPEPLLKDLQLVYRAGIAAALWFLVYRRKCKLWV
uniref:Tapasin-related protein n=1 Tax=Xenopus tropicalis TaxID=8364 RepID=A0A6I8SEZ8_XENTR